MCDLRQGRILALQAGFDTMATGRVRFLALDSRSVNVGPVSVRFSGRVVP